MASSNASNGTSVANSAKEPTPGDESASGIAAPTATFESQAKQALDDLKTLQIALGNVTSHAQVFSRVASAVDRHVDIEGEIQMKDARIASLQLTIDNQFDKFEERFIKWDVDRKELEEKIAKNETASIAKCKDLLQKNKNLHLQEVEKLKKTLEGVEKKSSALVGKLKDANLKIKDGEELFAKCSMEVEKWNRYVSELEEVDFTEFEAKIKSLSQRCCAIARNYIFCDIPERLFLDQNQWENIINPLGVPLPFPPSNSPVAKYVRMAACLHIIARTLCTEIFKPCYHPDSTSFHDNLKEILAVQFGADVLKERITRALILSTYSAEANTTAMMNTAQISATRIQTLLTQFGANEKFGMELENIFLEAGEIWKDTAQNSKKMIEAFTLDDFPGLPWATMGEFGIFTTNTTTAITPATATTATAAPKSNQDIADGSKMLNLFPCIYVPEDDKIVFSGIALFHSQGIVPAAQQEVARRPRSTWNGFSPVGSPTTRRERRMSSAMPDANGGLTTVSTTT